MVTIPMQPTPYPRGVNVWGNAMSASVEQEWSLTSSKPAPSAGRIGMLGFCRFGTIGFAAVVLMFALNYVATEAALAVQSKDYAQPAQSKDRDVQAAESKARGAQPGQSKNVMRSRRSPTAMLSPRVRKTAMP